MRLQPRRLALIAAIMAPALTGCGWQGLAGSKIGPIEIKASPIHLNPENPGQGRVGFLEFRGGLALDGTAGNFGGLSGLALSRDGGALVAVTDQGDVLRADLVHDKAGRLIGLIRARLHRLRGLNGEHLSRRADKRDQDAEAITRRADGSYLVSFEVTHRIMRYPDLAARPGLFAIPPGINEAPRNGGLEAMTTLPDGRVLVLTEKFRTKGKQRNDYIGWLLDPNGKSLGRVYWPGAGIFRPTDLAALPNGDVLLLQRRFTVMGGPGMRLSLIPAARIKPGARLLDKELARMAPPLSVDNFEGLAVYPNPAGGWTIYILSDDNFNPLQRTLLLQFQWSG